MQLRLQSQPSRVDKNNRGPWAIAERNKLRPGTGLRRPGKGTVLISNEKLRELYSALVTCRTMAGAPVTNGASGWIRGHEASLVAATIDLGAGDAVCVRDYGMVTGFSTGAAIAKTLLGNGKHRLPSTEEVRNGASSSAAGPDYTHAALGAALAHKTRTSRKVAVVFSSKETSEELREAVHIATVHSLPMVFVHQVDGEKHDRKAKSAKKGGAKTPWFPHIAVDRDDVVAAYRVASEAISRARLGRGPTLIECRPFPLDRNLKGGNGYHSHDPVRNMEHYLRAKGLFDPALKAELMGSL